MHLQFQVEASDSIGHGHVMRCAALAERAREQGGMTSFLAADRYTRELLHTLELPVAADADIRPDAIIIDCRSPVQPAAVHAAKARGAKVVLLDHQGPARAVADLVCDALIGSAARAELSHSQETTYLYGLDYVLLRRQFRNAHASSSPGQRSHPRLMLAMGGIDQHRVAPRLASALSASGFNGPATFVVERSAVERIQCEVRNWKDTKVLTDIADMASLMVESDLLVSKLGGLMLEAFCVGLGAAMIEPSVAHVELSASLAAEYFDWPATPLGLAEEVNISFVADSVLEILHDRSRLARMGLRGSALVDGLGCDRLLAAIAVLGAHE
jgi:UDP-2,4-diacetamido-2,4,6-trideoxy-beta-L-altropyranose hydrolase